MATLHLWAYEFTPTRKPAPLDQSRVRSFPIPPEEQEAAPTEFFYHYVQREIRLTIQNQQTTLVELASDLAALFRMQLDPDGLVPVFVFAPDHDAEIQAVGVPGGRAEVRSLTFKEAEEFFVAFNHAHNPAKMVL